MAIVDRKLDIDSCETNIFHDRDLNKWIREYKNANQAETNFIPKWFTVEVPVWVYSSKRKKVTKCGGRPISQLKMCKTV